MKGKVTSQRFVDVWLAASQRGGNIPWVARELGLTHQAVYARAAKMRADGVPLPELPRNDKQETRELKEYVVRKRVS